MPTLISRSVPELLRDTLRQLESAHEQQEDASFCALKRQIVRQLAELDSSRNSKVSTRPIINSN